jgi:hypothetical protein
VDRERGEVNGCRDFGLGVLHNDDSPAYGSCYFVDTIPDCSICLMISDYIGPNKISIVIRARADVETLRIPSSSHCLADSCVRQVQHPQYAVDLGDRFDAAVYMRMRLSVFG